MDKCEICDGKRWLICWRSEDEREAVERCDTCQDEDFSDEDAAILARQAGVACESEYPCYVIGSYL